MELRLATFYFLYFAHVGAYTAYFPLYLASRHLSAVEIAWVLALPALARIVAPAAWGSLADRSGAHRAIVAVSCAVSAAGFALIPFTEHIAWVIGVMSVLAAGALPLVEAITLAALAGRPERQLGDYGPIRVWGSVGFIIVVLGGGAWLDRQPIATLPWAMVACMLGAMVVALLLPGGRAKAGAERAALRVTPELAALLGAGFCNAVAHGALYAFLSLHLEREGYSSTMIGVLWTLGVVAEIAVFVWLPQLFRRYSLSTILVVSMASGVARFLAIGWAAGELWIVLLAQLLHAATFGSFHAAAVAAVHRVCPESAQARGQTLFSSVGYGAGAATGMLIAGWAWEGGGAGLAFTASALAAGAGAFLAQRLKRAGL
jgi:PPP family 3-phenylpropionic acid transporter